MENSDDQLEGSVAHQGGAIALMAAAAIALAACSGGGGLNEDEAAGLQQELKDAKADAAAALADQQLEEAARIAAEAAQALAEAEKLKAETEKVAAETARDAAVALAEAAEKSAAAAAASAQDAADALVEALAAQVEAEAKQAEAEAAQQDAEDAAAEADRLRRLAVAARAVAEQQRRDSDTARDQAEQETEDAREEAENLVQRADARNTLDGLRADVRINGVDRVSGLTHDGPAGTVMVTPRHGATASVTPSPSWGPSSSQRSSSSGWTVTTLSNQGFSHNDELVVYDNRRGLTSVPLTQEYDGAARFNDDDATKTGTTISGTIVAADGAIIKSGSFPPDGQDKTFEYNYDNPDVVNAVLVQDPDDDPSTDDTTYERYDTARVSGTFDGASGHFHCRSDACTIGRRGNSYVFPGASVWEFVTTDRATARIDDRSYAYFGWWRREQRSNETFSYLPFFDIAENAMTGGGQTLSYTATTGSGFDLLTGSATYRGPAIGQYAIYQPLGGQSGTGRVHGPR